MAVDFVAAGPIFAGVANLTAEWPGTHSAGDLGILLLETNQTDTVTVSGWTQIASSPQENSGQNHKLSVFYKIAAGDDADTTITDPGNHGIVQILVFSGVDASTPIEATTGVSPGTSDVSITCPSVTTTVDGCAILHIAGTGRDATLTGQYGSWTNANLISITEVADDVTSQAGGGGFGAAWGILATAGASGTATAVQNAAGIWTAITVALKPASAGGPAAELDGDATATATATGTLTTQIPLSGAAAVITTAAGALSTQIALAGVAATVSSAAGALSANITLSGAALSQALAAAGLTTTIALAGTAAGAAQADGDLASGAAQLASAASAAAIGIASLTTQIALSGAALVAALASGDLSATPAGLAGSATAGASATGALLTQIPLTAAAEASTTAAGGLTTIIQLAAAAASVSSATGALLVEFTLSGAALAQALAGGDLSTLIQLDAAAVARAAASGSLGGGSGVPAILRHLVEAASATWTVEASPGPWEVYA